VSLNGAELMGFKPKKKIILIFLLIGFSLTTLLLIYLFVTETMSLACSQKITKRLNLSSSDYVFIWLSSVPRDVSGLAAQPYTIRFYVTSPNNTTVLDQDPRLEAARLMHANIQNSTLIIINGYGHHLESMLCAQKILPWLQGLSE